MVWHMLCNIASERDINVNILEAMQMFSPAWRALKEEIISNCFRKAGVVYAEDDITESEVLDVQKQRRAGSVCVKSWICQQV